MTLDQLFRDPETWSSGPTLWSQYTAYKLAFNKTACVYRSKFQEDDPWCYSITYIHSRLKYKSTFDKWEYLDEFTAQCVFFDLLHKEALYLKAWRYLRSKIFRLYGRKG